MALAASRKSVKKELKDMEELFVFPLLSSVGFDVRTDFSNTLDALFLNDPDNAALLELEMMKC